MMYNKHLQRTWLVIKSLLALGMIVLVSRSLSPVRKDLENLRVLTSGSSLTAGSDISATFHLANNLVAYTREQDNRIFIFDKEEQVVRDIIEIDSATSFHGLVYHKGVYFLLAGDSILLVRAAGGTEPIVKVLTEQIPHVTGKDALRIDTLGKRLLIDAPAENSGDYSHNIFAFSIAEI